MMSMYVIGITSEIVHSDVDSMNTCPGNSSTATQVLRRKGRYSSLRITMSEATTISNSAGYTSARRWPRYKVDVPVRVIVCKEMKATIFDARGTSLSEGGM